MFFASFPLPLTDPITNRTAGIRQIKKPHTKILRIVKLKAAKLSILRPNERAVPQTTTAKTQKTVFFFCGGKALPARCTPLNRNNAALTIAIINHK